MDNVQKEGLERGKETRAGRPQGGTRGYQGVWEKGRRPTEHTFENFVIVWKVLFATFNLFQGKGFVTQSFPLV